MKRWSVKEQKETEPPEIDAFIEEIVSVYRKHGLSISHEDGHGAFVIESFDETNVEWLERAVDNRTA